MPDGVNKSNHNNKIWLGEVVYLKKFLSVIALTQIFVRSIVIQLAAPF